MGPAIQMDTFCPFLSLFTHANVICILFDFPLIVNPLSEEAANFFHCLGKNVSAIDIPLQKLIPYQFHFHISTTMLSIKRRKNRSISPSWLVQIFMHINTAKHEYSTKHVK